MQVFGPTQLMLTGFNIIKREAGKRNEERLNKFKVIELSIVDFMQTENSIIATRRRN
jgi:hypothetical protein